MLEQKTLKSLKEKRKQSILIDNKTNLVVQQAENQIDSHQQNLVNEGDLHIQSQEFDHNRIQNSKLFQNVNNKLMSQMSLGSKQELARDLLQSIVKATDNNGYLLQKKYNIEYLRQVLQRDLISFEMTYEKFVQENAQITKGVNLVDFIYIIVKLVDTPSYESLYLINAIIDFFEAVTQVEKTDSRKFQIEEKVIKQSKNYIKLPDITFFLCEHHPFNEQILPQGVKIPTKSLPIPKKFCNSTTQRTIREIDINAPVIFRDSNESIYRLNKDKIHIDSVHHNNNLIMKSIYAYELKKVIVSDQYSDTFIVYDSNCEMDFKFRPTSQHLRGQVCIDFFWSEKQMRIGSVFRDNFLAFWDSNDNFQFEKSFNIGESILEEQSKIWYISFIDKWVTSDNNKSINFWNLEKEEVASSITSQLFQNGIIALLEVEYLKVVAIGSSDNYVSVWDFLGQKLLFQINVSHAHLNIMSYFQTYQVILTGGYDNQICIYEFHPTYNDANKVGELQGHMSIVTAFKSIEGTPMIVSSDDKYNVKIWDVRTTNCIQSIDIDLRNPIKQIHATIERVFFQSSRVTSFEFDIDIQQKMKIKKKAKAQNSFLILAEGYQPLGTFLNIKKQELIVCTSRDVRFFDILNGKIKKIIASLSENQEDLITNFQILDSCQKILVSTQKGMLRIHDLKNGELLSEISAHTNEITGLKMDHLNKLLITTSSDSSILIQKINPKLQSQKYREVLNSHYGQEITLVEISVYHNIFITASHDNTLLIWSYEFGRLMASFELEQDQEPSALSIINGYSIMIIATTKGYLYFVKFTLVDDNLDLEIIANINIIKSLILRGEALKKLVASEAFQMQEKESRQLKNEKKKIQIQEEQIKQKGKPQQNNSNKPVNLSQITMTELVQPQANQTSMTQMKDSKIHQGRESKISPNESKNVKKLLQQTDLKKLNINKGLEDISKKKIDITDLYNENEVKIEGDDKDLFDLGLANKIVNKSKSIDKETKKESNIYANKIIFDLCMGQESKINFDKVDDKNKNSLPETCTLIIGVNNGEIRKYDISSLFKRPGIKFVPHCKNKMNYNAFRQNFENYTNALSNHKIQCFKQNKNNIIKDIIVLNNMNRSRAIFKFQQSVLKISQVRGLILNQDDSERPFDPYFNQSKNMIDLIQGHKSQLTSLEFIKIHSYQNENIITCGSDNYIKIWGFFGKITLIAAFNILHPLPIKWEFKVDFDLIYRNKMLFAIQSIEAVKEKFKTKIDFSLFQKFNIKNLINFIEQQEAQIQKQNNQNLQENKTAKDKKSSPQKNNTKKKEDEIQLKLRSASSHLALKKSNMNINDDEEEKVEDNRKIIKLMKDEYTPRDLLFNKVKHLYQKELVGPSLQQLQEIKRIENSKNQGNSFLGTKLRRSDEYQQYLSQEENNKQQKFISAFFHPDYRKKVLEKFNEAYYLDKDPQIFFLEKKLDLVLQQKHLQETQLHNLPQIQIQNPQPSSRINLANSPIQLNSQSTNQRTRQNSANQQSISKVSSVSPTRQVLSQVGDQQGIFVTSPPVLIIESGDQLTSKERSDKNIQGQLIIQINNNKINENQSFPLPSGQDAFDQKQKSNIKFNQSNQQIENSTGYATIQTNFLKAIKSQKELLPRTQQLYYTSKYYKQNNNKVKSLSQENLSKQLNFLEKQTPQSTNLFNSQQSNRYQNHSQNKDDFSLKKEAKEIFNFNKKVPQSTTEHFQTGGEYLIMINQLERNHGMKFKLFENQGKKYSQTQRNSVSPKQNNQLTIENNMTTHSCKQSIKNQVGSMGQVDPFTNNCPKEFLEYAQEKSLMSTQLQDHYIKQSTSLTKSQVKNFFLNQIENEEDKRKFNDKFESTFVQQQSYAQLTKTQEDQTQNQKSEQSQQNLKTKITKPKIPHLNLSQSNFNNNLKSSALINSDKKQNFMSLTQRGNSSCNANGFGQDIESTFDSSLFNNSKQMNFNKTSKRCFQDVVKNLNKKLSKSRINHHKEIANSSQLLKSQQVLLKIDSTNSAQTLNIQQIDEPNSGSQIYPLLSYRYKKGTNRFVNSNPFNLQLKQNQEKQQQACFNQSN